MNTHDLKHALHDANKERALIYLDIFREIRHRCGEQEATDILRTALEKRGRAFGKSLKNVFSPTLGMPSIPSDTSPDTHFTRI